MNSSNNDNNKAQFDLAHRAGRASSSAPAPEPWMRAVLDEAGRKTCNHYYYHYNYYDDYSLHYYQ